MAQSIQLSRAACDECFDVCWFAYDDSTGQTKHIDDLTKYRAELEAHGFYYAGHRAGVMTYRRARAAAPLMVDWQILIEAHEAREYIDIDQDW